MFRQTDIPVSVHFSFQVPCTAWHRTCTRSSCQLPDRVPPAPASAAEAALQAEASPAADSAAAGAAPSSIRASVPSCANIECLARDRFIQPALFRRLIRPQPHEHGRPQLHAAIRGFVGPLRKLNFSDKFRTHELDFSQSSERPIEWILFRLKRLQSSEHFLQRLVIEAGASLPHVD